MIRPNAAKKICFAYFAHSHRPYTPLDSAYAKANILQSFPQASVEIVRLEAGERLMAELEGLLAKDADVYIFVLDNILWSMMFYANAAVLLAREIKKQRPQTLVGFHSYKVTDLIARNMFKGVAELDFCLRGEPEVAMAEFYRRGDFDGVPGFVYRKPDGELQFNPDPGLVENLDDLPSPYLTGALDFYLENGSAQQVFMSTTRGCPFKCHFCSRSVKFSHVRTFSLERVFAELEYLARRQVPAVFMLDDCFIVNRRRFKEFAQGYEAHFAGLDLKRPDLYVMCRPEFLSDELLEFLPQANIVWVQIGLQTISPDSRYLMGSGVTNDDYVRIANKLYQSGINLQLDVIVGLPGDNLEYFKKTFDFAIQLRPSNLQVKQLYRNPNTLFDLHPERYGLETESHRHFFHVPFVTDSNTFSNEEIKQAAQYVIDNRNQGNLPRIKLITEFARFNDFGKASVSA
ncbi:MAG: radical SAM protein [Candidatus Eremiobacteraeota bacterium]|nr:radical SAM protein [Candidatus Eremiobacteraeota bacterium]